MNTYKWTLRNRFKVCPKLGWKCINETDIKGNIENLSNSTKNEYLRAASRGCLECESPAGRRDWKPSSLAVSCLIKLQINFLHNKIWRHDATTGRWFSPSVRCILGQSQCHGRRCCWRNSWWRWWRTRAPGRRLSPSWQRSCPRSAAPWRSPRVLRTRWWSPAPRTCQCWWTLWSSNHPCPWQCSALELGPGRDTETMMNVKNISTKILRNIYLGEEWLILETLETIIFVLKTDNHWIIQLSQLTSDARNLRSRC